MSERIRQARKEMHLTQDVLARKIGVTKGAVSQWELGNTESIKPKYLFRLEDVTGFNARWLALGDGPAMVCQNPPDSTTDLISRAIASILQIDESVLPDLEGVMDRLPRKTP